MMHKVEKYSGHPITKLAFRFIALTALRVGTVISLEWNDIKDDTLYIDAEKMKMKSDFICPLSSQAMEILNIVKDYFPSSTHSYKMMSNATLSRRLLRTGFQDIHTIHGFRKSFSTIMNELHPRDYRIIEIMLAHSSKNNIESIYNKAIYLDDRKRLAQEWGGLLYKYLPPASALVS